MPRGSPTPPSSAPVARVARNFLTLASGEAFSRLIAFGGGVYVARTVGASAYGIVAFGLAVMLYLSRLADFGIEHGLGIREVASRSDDHEALIGTLFTVRLGLTLLVSVIFAAVAWILAPQPDATVLVLIAIILAFSGVNTRWIHLSFEDTKTVAVARALGEITMVAVVVLLVRNAGDIASVPFAQIVGDTVLITLLALAIGRRGLSLRLRLDWAVIRPLIPRATSLTAVALLGLIMFNSDLLFLRLFRDTQAVGLYAVAYGLISFLINLGSAYHLSLLPVLTREGRDPDRQRSLLDTTVAQVFAVTLPATVGLFLYSSEVIGLIYGPDYAASAVPLAYLAWSVLLLLNRSGPQMALLASGKERRLLRADAIATVVNLTANVTLIPTLGILGAALSTVISEAVRYILTWWMAVGVGFRPPGPRRWWKPVAATGAMTAVILTAASDSLLIGVPLGMVTYGAVLGAVGGIGRSARGRPTLTV